MEDKADEASIWDEGTEAVEAVVDKDAGVEEEGCEDENGGCRTLSPVCTDVRNVQNDVCVDEGEDMKRQVLVFQRHAAAAAAAAVVAAAMLTMLQEWVGDAAADQPRLGTRRDRRGKGDVEE